MQAGRRNAVVEKVLNAMKTWEKCPPQSQKPEVVVPKLGPKGEVGVSQMNMRLSQMKECHDGGLIWKHAYVHKLIWSIEGKVAE